MDPRPYKDFPKRKSALIKWDANDRLDIPEPVLTLPIKLLPSLWNKDGLGAWRFDLDPLPVPVPTPDDPPYLPCPHSVQVFFRTLKIHTFLRLSYFSDLFAEY